MRKTTIASVFAIGCLTLAGVAYARGPKTTVTVKTNDTATFATVNLTVCGDESACASGLPGNSDCQFTLEQGNQTVKATCLQGKAVAFYGTIFVIDSATNESGFCEIPLFEPQSIPDEGRVFSCEKNSALVTVKVGNGN